MLLEEIFPVAAYYQDTWHEAIQSVCVAGLGTRLAEFAKPLEAEFHCEVRSLLHSDRKSTRLNSSHSQISYAVFCLKKKTTLVCIQQLLYFQQRRRHTQADAFCVTTPDSFHIGSATAFMSCTRVAGCSLACIAVHQY